MMIMAEKTFKRKFDDKEMVIVNQFMGFTISLIKAMVQTGYYSAEHPLAGRAVEGIYNELFLLMKDKDEILFTTTSMHEKDDVMIDGVLLETLSLKDVFRSNSLGDHYVSKFLDYFQRNNLVSFSIRKGIQKQEFERFIKVLVERDIDMGSDRSGLMAQKKLFSDVLYENRIFNIGVVHPQEVIGRHRQIPWRVQLAITRLRKNVRVLPLFSKATALEIAEVKRQIIADIVRPLRKLGLLKDLVVNSDLVKEGVEKDIPWDVEQEVVNNLHEGVMVPLAWEIVGDMKREIEKPQRDELSAELERRQRIILGKVAIRFTLKVAETAFDLIEYLVKNGIVDLSQLPDEVKERFRINRLVDDFQKQGERFLKALPRDLDSEAFVKQNYDLKSMFEELLRRQAHAQALLVLEALKSYSEDRTDRGRVARGMVASQMIAQVADMPLFLALFDKYRESTREERIAIGRMCFIVGKPTVPRLLPILMDDDRAQIRRDICNILTEMGPDIGDVLMQELEMADLPWQYQRNMIMILGDIKYGAAGEAVPRFLKHEERHVREEVLATLTKLGDPSYERFFLEALMDPEVEVRLKAITGLLALGSKHPRFASFVRETLRPRSRNEKEPEEEIQLRALAAARQLGNVAVSQNQTLEQVLAESVVPAGRFAFLKVFDKEARKPKSEKIRSYMCEVLGDIGTQASVDVLVKAMDDPSTAIKARAQAAITRIEARLAGKTSVPPKRPSTMPRG